MTTPPAAAGPRPSGAYATSPPSLGAARLDTRIHDTQGVLEIRATLRSDGHEPLEITYDDDGLNLLLGASSHASRERPDDLAGGSAWICFEDESGQGLTSAQGQNLETARAHRW